MRRFAVGAALALALAGCGGDPQSDPSPSPSSPVTSPVSTTPAAPVMPEEAKAKSKAGAIAFVEYYIALVNHAQATGDTEPLRSVEGSACRSCQSVREAIAEIYANGGSIEGGDWHPNLTVGLRNENGTWLVGGDIRFDPEQVRRASGSEPTSQSGGSAVAHFTVRNVGVTWEMIEWSRES